MFKFLDLGLAKQRAKANFVLQLIKYFKVIWSRDKFDYFKKRQTLFFELISSREHSQYNTGKRSAKIKNHHKIDLIKIGHFDHLTVVLVCHQKKLILIDYSPPIISIAVSDFGVLLLNDYIAAAWENCNSYRTLQC